ncbi:hypothetical protein [Virgibacillus oceani]|uniref:Uncharacterized protein n=1 Tax=Virgibacillus oceani TaxID=1479511 RepID=A0A917LXY8_9BACI|nr:hypothetical protein [Virgibacillus oceani]GGG64460.1 hypothetical protein GCM10011398_05060 [Virgibacillus oceani]
MTHEELSNEELIQLFKYAAQELITNGGGHARSYYYETEEAVLERMKEDE